jgi:uncharacterized protein YndB with AHSA1/START domain/precorrin-6B methylase 2
LSSPDRSRALEKYRRVASTYDARNAAFPAQRAIRRRAVDLLALRPGDTVLDVGCGTGLSLGLLAEKVGPSGRIVAIEQSPDMLARAEERIARHGWQNVTLVESALEDARISVVADAAFLGLVHDVMRSPRALENVVAHVRPTGRLAVVGAKWMRLLFPFNVFVWLGARRYVTTLEGFGRPWTNLATLIPDLQVRAVWFGGGYLAWGSVPGRSTRISRLVKAPREAVYRALLDASAIARWRVPTGMTVHVHEFDAREGGAFRISLFSQEPTGTGKSSAQTDTYHGRFVRLVANEQVVEVLEFETADPALRGEMTITTTLAGAEGGTEIRAVHEGLPRGLAAADNEAGWSEALAKLAALVEARAR